MGRGGGGGGAGGVDLGSTPHRPGNCRDRSQQNKTQTQSYNGKTNKQTRTNWTSSAAEAELKSIKYTQCVACDEKPRVTQRKIKSKPKRENLQVKVDRALESECLAFICIWAWSMSVHVCVRVCDCVCGFGCGYLFVCPFVWVCKYLKGFIAFLAMRDTQHTHTHILHIVWKLNA